MHKVHLWRANWFPTIIPYLFSSSSPPKACPEPEAMAAAHAGQILLLLFLPWQQLLMQLVKLWRTSQRPSVSLCLNPLMQFGSSFWSTSWCCPHFPPFPSAGFGSSLSPRLALPLYPCSLDEHPPLWVNCMASTQWSLGWWSLNPWKLERKLFISSMPTSSPFGTRFCYFNHLGNSQLPFYSREASSV